MGKKQSNPPPDYPKPPAPPPPPEIRTTTKKAAGPRRSVEFEIKIGADSPDELCNALESLARQALLQGFSNGNGACGGPSYGWTYTYSHDPSITHESYFEAIERWIAARDHD